ncbi:OB-fold nucleic acid binding domain-containing protein [Candidatus Nanohalococcus occultus]|uniref:RNA-binding protein, contains TRAM domain n=1 Tax=Candidatus Nanohalococcus occultus TaxID=2978047 RepID=A0ABY8CHA0_9ARCH|nr:Putative RNA-binding protein, contains TRAM domain [Candidatus Nanohaloarchaeota archaeon SVXNc]
MKDHYRHALVLSVIGLGLIHLSSTYITPEKAETDEIKPGWIGKKVTVDGTVRNSYRVNDTLFFDLEDSEGAVKVAEFESSSRVNDSQTVEVTGTVKLYEGSMEIIADRVE